MGAWSTESFGNDTACDWAYELDKTDDLSLVESAIETILEAGDGYLEAQEAEEGLAARLHSPVFTPLSGWRFL